VVLLKTRGTIVRTFATIAALGVLVGAGPALAQQTPGQPDNAVKATYDEFSLTSGAQVMTHRTSVRAGGDIDAGGVLTGCHGFIHSAPDVRFTYKAGTRPLMIGTGPEPGVILLVRDPAGAWHCNNGGETGEFVRFNEPVTGTYTVWLGARGGETPPIVLTVSTMTLADALGGS
jgi:hypothetical protein